MMKATPEVLDELIVLALKLWPDSSPLELKDDFQSSIGSKDEDILLYRSDNGVLVAFVQLSLRRHYVEGCETTPVAYIEGIYVEKDCRRKGIAQKMANYAKKWGKARGCKEIASDCELDNNLSILFHKGIDFKEVNRLVCFKTDI